MGQQGADGPISSSGHQFGYDKACAAGVPWGWVLRQKSPEQREREEKIEKANRTVTLFLSNFPELARYRLTKAGRTRSNKELLESKEFIDAVKDALYHRRLLEDERARRLAAARAYQAQQKR